LGHLDRSIATNSNNIKAFNLKSAILRNMGKPEPALEISTRMMNYDPLDMWSMYENYLAYRALARNEESQRTLNIIKSRIRDYIQTYLELSLDYANAGLWTEAIDILSDPDLAIKDPDNSYPMKYYYLGYFWNQKGNHEKSLYYMNQARAMPPDYCYPFRLESIQILETAIKMDPSDPRAPYYLGNLLYELQPDKAVGYWERSCDIDNSFPIVHRNLGMAYFQKGGECEEAVKACEKGLKRAPDSMIVHFMATTVFSACGKEKVARKTAKELLRISPKFSAESFAKRLPQKYQKDKDRITEALRKTGL